MQHEALPLFILLSTAIYLTLIYGILIAAKRLVKEEKLFKNFNIKILKNNIAYIIILTKHLLSRWIYNLLKNGSYHQNNLSKFSIDITCKVSLKSLQHVDSSN